MYLGHKRCYESSNPGSPRAQPHCCTTNTGGVHLRCVHVHCLEHTSRKGSNDKQEKCYDIPKFKEEEKHHIANALTASTENYNLCKLHALGSQVGTNEEEQETSRSGHEFCSHRQLSSNKLNNDNGDKQTW